MALSVPNSNSGPGLSNLLRQTRQAKAGDNGAASPSEPSTQAAVRPTGRGAIDSTQRGTAQITAALTVYLSKLGGSDDGAPVKAVKAVSGPTTGTSAPAAPARSGAADLLRTLDSYRAPSSGFRLTA